MYNTDCIFLFRLSYWFDHFLIIVLPHCHLELVNLSILIQTAMAFSWSAPNRTDNFVLVEILFCNNCTSYRSIGQTSALLNRMPEFWDKGNQRVLHRFWFFCQLYLWHITVFDVFLSAIELGVVMTRDDLFSVSSALQLTYIQCESAFTMKISLQG